MVNSAALALLLVAAPGGNADPSALASPADATPAASGWRLGAGGRNALAVSNPSTPDFGGDLFGGVWLLDEHLQPIVDIGWSRVFGLSNGLAVDTFRAGGGAAGWAIVHGYLWMGGAVGAAVQNGWLHEAGNPLAFGAMVFASGLLEGRIAHRLLIGVELGPSYSGPALQFSSPSGPLSILGGLRLEAGVRLGLILGR